MNTGGGFSRTAASETPYPRPEFAPHLVTREVYLDGWRGLARVRPYTRREAKPPTPVRAVPFQPSLAPGCSTTTTSTQLPHATTIPSSPHVLAAPGKRCS